MDTEAAKQRLRERRALEREEMTRDDCICSECGKQFKFGTEADNETLCLRCDYLLSQEESFE